MNSTSSTRHSAATFARRLFTAALFSVSLLPAASFALDLADSPLFSTDAPPGNLILALSVEWPTATTPAYPSTTPYNATSTFLGYFDPAKCYRYVVQKTGTHTAPDYSTSYFAPHSAATDHACRSTASVQLWSGNYLNWSSMQTLDAFRWVLTGGYRSVDTTTMTVLSKTYAAKEGTAMPQKTLAKDSLAGATPFTADAWTSGATTRLRNLGRRMWITSTNTGKSDTSTSGASTSGATPYTGQNSWVDSSSSDYANPSTTYELYINVLVCDPNHGLESNCTPYGTNYKPEGLMQAYSSSLRYSAFGYYNHNDQRRDGGVMRARMKYIGPMQPVPGSESTPNDNAEWDASTGVMTTNPDKADAEATTKFAAAAQLTVSITDSGVMNYLNKFGNYAHSYKENDPVSELFYAALRYYKNLGNVSAYTTLEGAGNSGTAAKWLDGFPAITDDAVWKASGKAYGSPILYSCQKNFILGIGDVNAHLDANLYGSTIRTGLEPTMPREVEADTSINVKTATDMVGQLEGLKSGSLGGIYADSSSTTTCVYCSSYYIAGLAYDAHTNDIRTDMPDKQTVNTYWMDVMENQTYKRKNQYWLAAKYGGFETPANFSPYSGSNGPTTLDDSTWHKNTDTLTVGASSLNYSTNSGNADKRPDNYFTGSQPDAMKAGLTKAFAKMASETKLGTSTALSLASPNVTSNGTVSYAASYEPKDWTGQLIATKVSFKSDGTPSAALQWNARDVLDSMVTATDSSARKIVTCCTADNAALPFTYKELTKASLSPRTYFTSFSNVPDVDEKLQSASNFVAYLRGESAQEIANKGSYRNRSHLLGDIVNSKPIAVAGPRATYYDTDNPGYSAFKSQHAGRTTVVYVGSNDGMLHAFDGSTGSESSGKELFAYIPSFVYGDSNSATTSGLASLGSASYAHHFFVDATPTVVDANFANTSGSNQTAADWRSVLISGLGKGGKGYFAIDVTDPSSWTTDDRVASKVLWEFTDSRMGYSYGTPSLVKTKKYGWVVIFTSGYGNSDGKGYFFFVNPATGTLLEAVATPEGSTSSPLDIAHHTAFVPDYTDFTADAIYAGDMQGNVWRMDVSGTGNYASPTKIAKLANDKGTSQAVTTRPLVETDPNSKKRYVMIGTGRLLADSDILSPDLQSFYAIIDGTSSFGGFYSASTLPSSATLPITRSQLQANADLVAGIGSAPTSVMGWYFDLGSSNGIAERMNVQPVANAGSVAFAANLPNGQTCSSSGTGRDFVVSFATGKTQMIGTDNSPAISQASSSVITDLSYQRVNGKLRVYSGSGDGSVVKIPANLSTAAGLKQLNWREVKAVD
jgi:type IV pilus assembly protein PilY1